MNPSNNLSLNTPVSMLEKCVREASRSYLAKEHYQSIDSFYNFCISVHSLRDWLIKFGIEQNSVHQKFNSYDLLIYCRDIANGFKHFGLDPTKVSSVVSVEAYKSNLAAVTLDNQIIHGANLLGVNTSFFIGDNVEITAFDFFFKTLTVLNEIFKHFSIPVSNACNPATFAMEFIPIPFD